MLNFTYLLAVWRYGNKVLGEELDGRRHYSISYLQPPFLLPYNELDICAAHLMHSRSEDP